MTENELSELIARGEGPEVVFRRSLGRELGRELCAFANGDGGTLLVGVSGSGGIAGIGNHNRARGRVLTIARSADPPIEVKVESVGDVLCVIVPPQKFKPYSIGWRAFVREGRISRRLSNAQIEDLFYAVGRAHFDKKPCPGFSLEKHLDDDVWERFVRRAKIPEAMHAVMVLRNLGLVDAEDQVTHAGAWLFAHNVRRFTDGAYTSCALFDGADEVGRRERREFHSAIPTMIDEVLAWILTRISVQLTIWQGEGEERPELPQEALLEALVNAVAHRDYRSSEGLEVHVFRDRVEIVSPGGLTEGMTEADLGTKSVPRNPLLYGVLARMGLVGEIGSGIRRMARLCREYGVEEPRVTVSGDRVTTTFIRPRAIQEQRPAIQGGASSTVQVEEPSAMPYGPALGATVPPGTPYKPTAQQLLSYRTNTSIIQEWATTIQVSELVSVLDQDRSRVEILECLGLRNRSNLVVNYLRPALDADFIEMTIPDKPTSGRQKYRLTSRGREFRAHLGGDGGR